MKVLIADDSGFMRTIIKDMVVTIDQSVEIFEASNGKEALDIYSEHHPDLVLLDIIMPEVDGIEVLKTIGEQAKVVVISSLGQEKVIEEAKRLGAKDFIEKPFDTHQVKEKLQQLLTSS